MKNFKSFEKAYNDYAKDLYRFIYSRCGNSDDAKDLLQETFLTYYDVQDNFKGNSSLKTFIYGIASNKIKNYWKTKSIAVSLQIDPKSAESFENEINEDDKINENENLSHQIVNLILDKLPENYRRILVCRFIDRLSIKQTAKKLNLTVTNVTTLQSRALQKARLIMKNLNFKNL